MSLETNIGESKPAKSPMALVRRLQQDDFDSYTELFEQVDRLHREAHPEYFWKTDRLFRTPEYFKKLLEDSTIYLVGAFEGSKAVGLAHAVLIDREGTELHTPFRGVHLDNLVVDKRHRGRGIGKLLYGSVCDWAKEAGAIEIHLKVYRFNEEAMAFYQRLGFSDLHIAMRRTIGDKCDPI